MKQLWVNDKRLVIDEENMSFPFTYTMNDLENVNVINVPISKDIEVPRCSVNDEVFGYIGNLTRITTNLSENELVGISFNQTKKCTYKLYNESEIVSEGLLIVTEVTEDNYIVQLQDALIEKLEILENKKLNDIYLFDRNDEVIEFKSNADAVINSITLDYKDFVPTLNFDTVGSSNLLVISTDENSNQVELPSELVPLQARTFKSYEVDWAMPITKVINSINRNLLGIWIDIDERLTGLFEDVHLIMNKPKNNPISVNSVSKVSPNANLIQNPAYIQFSATDSGTGSSVLNSSEREFFQRCTPQSGKAVSVSGASYTFVTGKTYIASLWVRHQYASPANLTIYESGIESTSSMTFSVLPNTWTRINTNSFSFTGSSNIVVVSALNDLVIDYKKAKVESATLTSWVRNVSDSDFNFDVSKKDFYIAPERTDKYALIYRFDDEVVKNRKIVADFNFEVTFNANRTLNSNESNVYMLEWIDKTKLMSNDNGVAWVKTVLHPVPAPGQPTEKIPVDGVTQMGKLWMKTSLVLAKSIYDEVSEPQIIYESDPQVFEIPMIKETNTTFNFSTGTMTVNGHFPATFEFWGDAFPNDNQNLQCFAKFELYRRNPNDGYHSVYPFLIDSAVESTYEIKILSSILTSTTMKFRTGDVISAKTVAPAIQIKDFLTELVKSFNLGLRVKDNNLYIFKKNYRLTDELPIIDETNFDINTDVITFNTLNLNTSVADTELMKDYINNTGKHWGEKTIKTGYSIKESVKNVNFGITIPILYQDANAYAYDAFINYRFGGHNAYNHGNIEGTADTIKLAFLNRVNVENTPLRIEASSKGITISDDHKLEIKNSITDTEETKWGHVNTNLKSAATSYEFVDNKNLIFSYFTASPYKFDIDGNVVQSLDMNKPAYNFASLNDSQYPESSTLYDMYHKKMISDKYSPNTHIIKTNMYLDKPVDEFLIYNWKNSQYVISDLPEYDPTLPGVYEVELMKVNDINNYVLPSTQILKANVFSTNPTSDNNSNGVITIEFVSGSGNYNVQLYSGNVLVDEISTTENSITFDTLIGGKDYQLRISDDYSVLYRNVYLIRTGKLNATYSYTRPTVYANNDATVSFSINEAVPTILVQLLDTSSFLIVKEIVMETTGSYTFTGIDANGTYLLYFVDSSDESNELTFSFTIPKVKKIQYTLQQELKFSGNRLTNGDKIYSITNDIMRKTGAGTYVNMSKIQDANHTFTFDGTDTNFVQTTLHTEMLEEGTPYTYKLVNDKLHYVLTDNETSSTLPVEYELYDTGIFSLTALNGSSSSIIMNNSQGYAPVIINTGYQYFGGLTITPVIERFYEYSDDAYKMVILTYIEGIEINRHLDQYTSFSYADFQFQFSTNGDGNWESGQEAYTTIETGYYSGIYWQRQEVDFGYGYFNSVPEWGINIKDVKGIRYSSGSINNIILSFSGTDFGPIFVTDGQDLEFLYQDESNRHGYTTLEGDNGTLRTELNVKNYKVTANWTVS